MISHADPARLPPHVRFVLGIDGGGTSTRARLARPTGEVLGEGKAGASGLGQGIEQAWRNIELAIERAAQASGLTGPQMPRPGNCALGIGLAGANNAVWRAEFMATNPGYALLVVDSDSFTALLGAHRGKPGGVVIVGTGSIAQALHADGTRSTSGGWGFPSGDEGSGAGLGLRATTLTQHALDGRRLPSELTRAVLSATGGSAAALLDWCCKAGQHEYATLAPLVFDCEAEDQAAAQLLQDAVQAMERLAVALDPDAALPLALWGSIGQRLAPRLAPSLQARLVPPQADALQGAIQLLTLNFA